MRRKVEIPTSGLKAANKSFNTLLLIKIRIPLTSITIQSQLEAHFTILFSVDKINLWLSSLYKVHREVLRLKNPLFNYLFLKVMVCLEGDSCREIFQLFFLLFLVSAFVYLSLILLLVLFLV